MFWKVTLLFCSVLACVKGQSPTGGLAVDEWSLADIAVYDREEMFSVNCSASIERIPPNLVYLNLAFTDSSGKKVTINAPKICHQISLTGSRCLAMFRTSMSKMTDEFGLQGSRISYGCNVTTTHASQNYSVACCKDIRFVDDADFGSFCLTDGNCDHGMTCEQTEKVCKCQDRQEPLVSQETTEYFCPLRAATEQCLTNEQCNKLMPNSVCSQSESSGRMCQCGSGFYLEENACVSGGSDLYKYNALLLITASVLIKAFI